MDMIRVVLSRESAKITVYYGRFYLGRRGNSVLNIPVAEYMNASENKH